MGFLSGVLSNIKGHLGQHKDAINIAINALRDNKHAGKKGFNAAIGEVVEGVRGYNDAFIDSNKKVSDPIEQLQDQMKELRKQVSDVLNVNAVSGDFEKVKETVSKAEPLVKKSIGDVVAFEKEMHEKRHSIFDLNFKLRHNVNITKNNIVHERERLVALSTKEWNDMVGMFSKVSDVLSASRTQVNEQIKLDVSNLVVALKFKVENVKVKLEEIDKALGEYVYDLSKWMRDIQSVIISARKLQVDKIIYKQVGDGNAFDIKQKAQQLKKMGEELFWHVDGAKRKVKELVEGALQAVKTMDGKLKEDLYVVKTRIKEAITHLGKTLASDVKQDLFDLEANVKSVFSKVRTDAATFSEKFKVTKAAITSAIERVYSELDKLRGLEQLEKIADENGKAVEASFLTSVQKDVAFDGVSDYFEKLDSVVMQPVQQAIEKIGDVWSKFATGANYQDVQSAVKKAADDLKSLDEIANGAVSFPDIGSVKISEENLIGVDNIKGVLGPNVSNIHEILPTLGKQSNTINREQVKNLLTDLGNISKAVSKHTKDVLLSVIDVVNHQVQKDIEAVAATINAKVYKIQQGIKSAEEKMTERYGLPDGHDNARGLEWLVQYFDEHIKQIIDSLDVEVGEKFKKRPGLNTRHPSTPDQYDFGEEFMKRFKQRHDSNLIRGTLNTTDGNSSVLDVEIGPDIFAASGTSEKISDLAQEKFTNYRGQVIQDTLTYHDINQLDGILPTSIKSIRENGLTTLESKINEMANGRIKKGTLYTLSDDITTDLNNLLTAFEQTGREIDRYLSGLKDASVATHLETIRNKFDHLRIDRLTGAIKCAQSFIDIEAPKLQAECITELQQFVTEYVGIAQDQLTHEARIQYVTSIQEMLKAFATKVSNELYELPQAIENDKHIGFKGLMEELYNSLVFSIVPQKEPKVVRELAFKFQDFVGPLKRYMDDEIKRLHEYNNNQKYPVPTNAETLYTPKVANVYQAFNKLLSHIATEKRYNYQVPGLLDDLEEATSQLKPDTFENPNTAILDGIRDGLGEFVKQLRKVYINKYDGHPDTYFSWNQVLSSEPSEYGKKGARICMTAIYTLYQELRELFYFGAKDWRNYSIKMEKNKNALTLFFVKAGYDLTNLITRDTGALRITGKLFTGFHKYGEFNRDPNDFRSLDECAEYFKKHEGPTSKLFDYLEKYNEVGHFTMKPKVRSPRNVYEMLIWFSGLPYNVVYSPMRDLTISELLDDPNEDTDDADITVMDTGVDSLAAFPTPIKYDGVIKSLDDLCSKSYELLTNIAGTGDEFVAYACEYCNNSFNLYYPANPSECFDMLVDILHRLWSPLKFLHSQCSNLSSDYGWFRCSYGKNVALAKWQCKDHPKAGPNCQAECQSNCQPTSPLMSYLNDCLPGHLPHKLESIGCKYKCNTCPISEPGMPCITPLGFRAFSGSTRQGKDLCNIIENFFLTMDTASIFCLRPKPPSSLAEHFGFALSVAQSMNANKASGDGKKTFSNVFEKTIDMQTMELYKKKDNLTNSFINAYGSEHVRHNECQHNHLKNLTSDSICMNKAKQISCSPYLSPLCSHTYAYLANKHSALYLSWAVYLPWQLHRYLECLLKAFSNIKCEDWGCRPCLQDTSCKAGNHGVENSKKPGLSCGCISIVSCRGVLPTLYQYGFTFFDAGNLISTSRKCHKFRTLLHRIIQSDYFTTLFDKCDDFLYQIRFPFIWLNVALWLLSLLYLIHIMVIRLDLLHIKSHLHSPSSHRIAAQSLLAAGRVHKLNRVFYLQP